MVELWHLLLLALGTNEIKRSVLAACSIYFLKTINWIDVQKYLFGIDGLNAARLRMQTDKNAIWHFSWRMSG